MPLLLTSSVISLLAVFWVWMAGRKDPLGRPWMTALCLLLLFALPALALLPKMSVQVLESMPGSRADGISLVYWLWIVGIVLMSVRLIRSYWILDKWINDSVEAKGWQFCMDECAQMLAQVSFSSP